MRRTDDAELREQFIAVLGHDLRNPLASISAGIGLIQKSKLDERAEAVLMLMQKSVTRMDQGTRVSPEKAGRPS
jgi:phosphoserine phosphatase RsbU/P